MEKVRIGVIGGSGIYEIEDLTILDKVSIGTPFGLPSDKIVIGKYGNGEPVAFLPRHGKGHRYLPTEVNSKANIWAMKYLGVERIIAVSAVGSLKEEIHPGDIVIPDQIIDRTRSRPNSYFGDGIVGHVGFSEPFCPDLRKLIIEVVEELGFKLHKEGTYVCMEGPLFSTKAESFLYRSWGASLIGMTALPESKLAREAEICYAMIALPTDYDCWHESEEVVNADMVMQQMKENVIKAKQIIRNLIYKIPVERTCLCKDAAANAIVTTPEYIPYEQYKKLELFYGKYLKEKVRLE